MTDDVLLLTGDCAEVMHNMEKNTVDLVLTSPPYDGMRAYNGFSIDIDQVIDGIWHVLKTGGVCIWITGDQMVKGSESCNSFKTALKFVDRGFLLHDTMIYKKKNPIPNVRNDRVRYHQSFEYMFCFSKGKPNKFKPIKRDCLHKGKRDYSSTFRNRGLDALEKRTEKVVKNKKVSDNVFVYTVGNESTTSYKPAFKHPAIFPERLACDQIKSWTDEGDTVLDPMCGSGTTVFCANALKRKAIGIDISSEYIELTRHRIKEEPIPKWLES